MAAPFVNYELERKEKTCNCKMQVYSRVVGFIRPIDNWNDSKREEFSERTTFKVNHYVTDKRD